MCTDELQDDHVELLRVRDELSGQLKRAKDQRQIATADLRATHQHNCASSRPSCGSSGSSKKLKVARTRLPSVGFLS